MKLARLAPFFALFLVGISLLGGCGRKIYSDLELQNARFSVDERGKSNFSASIKNTGNASYNAVFLVVDAYANDEYVLRLESSARILAGQTLAPGQTTSVSRNFEDGGLKPNRA